ALGYPGVNSIFACVVTRTVGKDIQYGQGFGAEFRHAIGRKNADFDHADPLAFQFHDSRGEFPCWRLRQGYISRHECRNLFAANTYVVAEGSAVSFRHRLGTVIGRPSKPHMAVTEA